MKLLIQRVKYAQLKVDGSDWGEIAKGLLVYVGFSKEDTDKDIEKVFKRVVDKIVGLRVFPDDQGKMNLSVKDIRGGIMLVSNFTLYAYIDRGKRPSFTNALNPSIAVNFYKKLEENLRDVVIKEGLKMVNGVFGSYMEIYSLAWGPVNIVWES